MGGLKKRESQRIRQESVDLKLLPADARDREIADLQRPWVAEEGPIEARFRRLEDSTEPLLPRGLAFDALRTVTWDEDGVQVISAAEMESGVVALYSPVVVRKKRFADIPELHRVDYLKSGTWLASRYFATEATTEETVDGETSHA